MTDQGLPEYVKLFSIRSGLSAEEDSADLVSRTLADPRIAAIVQQLRGWPGRALSNHKDFSHPLHQLSFLVELGLTRQDRGFAEVYKKIIDSQSPEGPFQLLIDIPQSFGGSGKPENAWVLSDAPLTTYCAIRLNGNVVTKPIQKALEWVAGLVAENGWRCAASANLGRFRGPGRKNDPCPYATLLGLKMLSTTSANEYKEAKEIGLRTVLSLWDDRETARPYLFGMGTDFKKLKLPFVWYDILHVVDVLSNYPQVHRDRRFKEMVGIIRKKNTPEGFVPESVYLSAKEWDFGQKKRPSALMSAVVRRIESRLENAA